jgi:hypothetical protein
VITHNVAPTGSASAEDYRSVSFWDGVAAELKSGDDVTVVFRRGEYSEPAPVQGSRTRVGRADRILTLVSEEPGAAAFTIVPDVVDQSDVRCERRDMAPRPFYLRNAENVVLSGMTFTGPGTIGYVVRVEGVSNHVTIRDCAFRDLPGVVFGATGATHPSTRNVVVERCSFRNVGCDSHAHMMYNDHGAHHITVRKCRFEECAGDYVRFRDRVDHCVVDSCTFIHRGDLYRETRPFVAVPVFNDCRPGSQDCPDPLDDPAYEYLGTHFTVKDNIFEFRVGGDRAFVLGVLHTGWDPPRRAHLLSEPEGQLLERGTARERMAILREHFGIDMTAIRFYGNAVRGERHLAALESYASHGATSPRWQTFGKWEAKGKSAVDISDLLNRDQPPDGRWLEPVSTMLL